VLMLSKYRSVKKILLVLPLIFLSLAINAQNEEQADSTRILSQDLDRMTDTLEEPPPEEVTVDEEYQDEPAVTKTVYFSNKQLQSNGGGPDSLRSRTLPDSIVKKMQTDDDFWYVNYLFEKEKKKQKKENIPLTEQPLFQTILWLVIIGGFTAFVIMYLANSNVGLFRKANKTIAAGEEGYTETDNIFEINYQREIDKAVSSGNYRLAVRLLFLRTLKNLSDKKVIQYKQDRTNFDYLLQLDSTKYYADFFRLTRNYEYSWYGQFDIEPEKFTIIKNDFENFDRNLK
jgi:hypothetical protein